jgi:hypothetical protein
MASLAAPEVNPDRCPAGPAVDESPARMSTYRYSRRVLLVRRNRVKETRRSSHESGHECTQISWSRCCHVDAGCALSMQGTSVGNRIKETTRTHMKETIRNAKSTVRSKITIASRIPLEPAHIQNNIPMVAISKSEHRSRTDHVPPGSYHHRCTSFILHCPPLYGEQQTWVLNLHEIYVN